MKKIYFAAFALLSLLLTTSCSNDDIEVATVGRIHKVSLNINTKGIYENFEIDSYVLNQLLYTNSQSIGVKTLVYNEEGNLIGEKESHEQAYNNVIHSFDLEEGKHYTIITLEFLLTPDNDYESDAWDVLDTQKISTLKIKQKEDYDPTIYDVAGVKASELLLYKEESLNVTPEAIGSRINFHPFNFKNAYGYDGNGNLGRITEICLGTHVNLDYYSPNPSLTPKDRFVRKLEDEGYARMFAYMDASDSDDYYSWGYVIDSEVELSFYYHTESMQDGLYRYYYYNDIKSQLENGKTYQAAFCYIDPYSYPESGLFESYEKLLEWEYQETPTTGLYKEPYTTWGASVSTVKSYMSSYSLLSSGTENNKYVLTYYGKNREKQIRYWFESQTGGLYSVTVFLDPSEVGDDELQMYFYDMGYSLLYSSNNFWRFKKNENIYIEAGMNNNNLWYVRYYNPASSIKEFSEPIEIPTFAPKRDALGQPSKVTINKDAVKSKLLQAKRAFSMKEAK